MRDWHFRDPVTGDELSLSEKVSWLLQGLIRRWSFIGIITVLTIVVWVKGAIWSHDLTDIWNLVASYMALFIESIVGLSMFSQTRRDAVILREIRRLVAHIDSIESVAHLVERACDG